MQTLHMMTHCMLQRWRIVATYHKFINIITYPRYFLPHHVHHVVICSNLDRDRQITGPCEDKTSHWELQRAAVLLWWLLEPMNKRMEHGTLINNSCGTKSMNWHRQTKLFTAVNSIFLERLEVLSEKVGNLLCQLTFLISSQRFPWLGFSLQSVSYSLTTSTTSSSENHWKQHYLRL